MGILGDSIATAAGGGIVGLGAQLLGGIFGPSQKKKDKMQLEQQGKLGEQAAATNYKWNEKAADNSFGRTMQMYERELADNSPEAQVQRLKNAGLSTGLMYGGAGSTGGANVGGMAQGGASGGASSGNAPNSAEQSNSRVAQMGMALQLAKLGSEVKLNESQALKNTTEATKTGGVDTELTETNIENITKDIANKEIQNLGMRLQNEMDKIKLNVSEKTEDQQIDSVVKTWELLSEELTKAVRENDIGEEMVETTKATMKQNLRNLIVEEIQKRAGTKLTDRQTTEIGQQIDLQITKGKVDVTKMALEMAKMGIEVDMNNVNNIAKLMGAILGTAGNITGAGIISGRKK